MRTDKRARKGENERLLSEFERSCYEEWRAEAERSLKGAPFEKKLLKKSYEGIVIQPIYEEESSAELPHIGGWPGVAPYARGARVLGRSSESWEVCQESVYPIPGEVNEELIRDLERGQTAIELALDRPTRLGAAKDEAKPGDAGPAGMSIADREDMARAFEKIDLARFPLYLQAGSAGIPLAALLISYANGIGLDTSALKGCVQVDPIGELASGGSLPCSLAQAYLEMAALSKWAIEKAPGLRTIGVSGCAYGDGGASAVQELAFVLATGVEYMREMIGHGLTSDDAGPKIRFSFSIGSDLFMEVAKLRAARLVWAQAVSAFGAGEEAARMTIHARTSRWNKSALDPSVNMLRATTEAFSAAIGGADSIHTSPFDEPVRLPDDFSRRIARNAQIVLKEESHLNHVIDPAGGSWYVERLTHEVASGAWEIFREVERRGGMSKSLFEGYPQALVREKAEEKEADLAFRRSVLVGTNMFCNAREKRLEKRDIDNRNTAKVVSAAVGEKKEALKKLAESAGRSSLKIVEAAIAAAAAGATLGEMTKAIRSAGEGKIEVEPIRRRRAAKMYEELRAGADEFEKNRGKKPAVFLANMGPISQHKARADFSTAFFEAGGFEVIGNNGFETPEEAAKAAAASGAEIAVVCSTDETYPELAPRFVGRLREAGDRVVVVVAGFPKDHVDALRKAGVDEFIHLKANNRDLLAWFLKKAGEPR